jgi:hypothetical protein
VTTAATDNPNITQQSDVEFVEKFVSAECLFGVRKAAQALWLGQVATEQAPQVGSEGSVDGDIFLQLLVLQKQVASRSFGRSWSLAPGQNVERYRLDALLSPLRQALEQLDGLFFGASFDYLKHPASVEIAETGDAAVALPESSFHPCPFAGALRSLCLPSRAGPLVS